MDRISIAVFDEEPIFLAGIVHVLHSEPGMEVVAEGTSASAARRLSKELSPDVVVLDANIFDELHSARTTAAIPFVKPLVLSFNMDTSQVCSAFAAGARGYVFKGVDEQQLREAVRAVHRGKNYLSPSSQETR